MSEPAHQVVGPILHFHAFWFLLNQLSPGPTPPCIRRVGIQPRDCGGSPRPRPVVLGVSEAQNNGGFFRFRVLAAVPRDAPSAHGAAPGLLHEVWGSHPL